MASVEAGDESGMRRRIPWYPGRRGPEYHEFPRHPARPPRYDRRLMSASPDAQDSVSAAADTTALDGIGASVGTPAYVYDADAIRRAYRRLDDAFGRVPHAIHYALKANSALAIA